MKNLFNKSHLSFLTCLLWSVSTLFLTGCFQENIQEQVISQEVPSEQIQRAFIQFGSNFPIDKLNQEQIEQKYQEMVRNIPEEHRVRLIELIEEGLSRSPNYSRNSIAAKKSESLLSNGISDDGFGIGVATAGNKVYVGANNTQEVFEYAKTGGTYNLVNTITPSVPTEDFGYNVAVSGNWLAVAAPEYGPPYPSGEGKIYMYEKQADGSWAEHSILTAPIAGDHLGGDGIALKGDQLIATKRNFVFPTPGGDIEVFNLSGNTWVSTGTIHKAGYDWVSVDMDNSGDRIIGTGAINQSFVTIFATIFVKTPSGWVEEDEVVITPPNPFSIVFPRDVAIQNGTAVLTAVIPGTIHWVLKNDGGDWSVDQELNIPADVIANRWTAMHGSNILIGVSSFASYSSDKVYVFKKKGSAYNLTETLSPADGGADVIMSDLVMDGNTIVVGATRAAGTTAPGKTYVFD